MRTRECENGGSLRSYEVDCQDTVHSVEFCPYEWCTHLLAIGTVSRIIVSSTKFQEEWPESTGVSHDVLRVIQHGQRVSCISWSPDTNLGSAPRQLRVATAGADSKVRIFTTDMKDQETCKVLDRHTDYVNAVSYEPGRGEYLASISDDCTCRVWNREGHQNACFALGSTGMSVCWHLQDPLKLLVGEKKGVLRLYNVPTQEPLMTLDCYQLPLMDVDWNPRNDLIIAAVSRNEYFIFDTSRSSIARTSQSVHQEGVQHVRWSRCSDSLLASTGRGQIKVTDTRSGHTLLTDHLPVANGLSWHPRLPLVAMGSNKKVCFWYISRS